MIGAMVVLWIWTAGSAIWLGFLISFAIRDWLRERPRKFVRPQGDVNWMPKRFNQEGGIEKDKERNGNCS